MIERTLSETPPPGLGMVMWRYRRPFSVDGRPADVIFASGLRGMESVLTVEGVERSRDFTPASGTESTRNHRHQLTLDDGRSLDVEGGYCNWTNVAIAVRIEGKLVHESHPGTVIQLPERARTMMTNAASVEGNPTYDIGKLRDNRYAIGVDIALGLLFFIVAKLTDLRTAALVGAAAGLGLIIAQRFVKVDIIGGMALFGVFMLLVSAGFAIVFEDEEIIKQRSTIVGLVGASLFLLDGALGGKRLGRGISRYIAYTDLDERRLAIAMGLIGLIMAATNWLIVRLFSTDVWLFYTTFVDIFFSIGMVLFGVQWARRKGQPAA